MNIELLKKVRAKIKEEPFQFEISYYITKELYSKDRAEITIPNCGTAACIGGWTVCLAENNKPSDYLSSHSIGQLAKDYLELENGEQARRLFHLTYWPEQFKRIEAVWFTNLIKKQQSNLAVERINHFIKTEGKE